MRVAGRISLVYVAAIAGVVVVSGLLLMGRESLTAVGGRFMSALAKGDVNTLTKMSYLGDKSEEDIRKQWDFAVNHAGKYYQFGWRVTATSEAEPNVSGSVRLSVARNIGSGSSYEENFQLPVIMKNGMWKVDVRGISRELYPGLPR